jgi:hypothetical protein
VRRRAHRPCRTGYSGSPEDGRGIRMSLGATRGRVLGEVLRDGMGVVLIGFAAGILGALAAGRVMASLRSSGRTVILYPRVTCRRASRNSNGS